MLRTGRTNGEKFGLLFNYTQCVLLMVKMTLLMTPTTKNRKRFSLLLFNSKKFLHNKRMNYNKNVYLLKITGDKLFGFNLVGLLFHNRAFAAWKMQQIIAKLSASLITTNNFYRIYVFCVEFIPIELLFCFIYSCSLLVCVCKCMSIFSIMINNV